MPITLIGRAARRRFTRRPRGLPETEPPRGARPSLRLLTLNVAHARRQARHQALLKVPTLRRNLAAIAEVLRREAPDVVALQEADGPSAWSGGFDHVETLADLAGFEHAFRGEHNPFSLGTLDLSSGTALLSRLALSEPRSRAFLESWRDTKGFVAATVTPRAFGGLAVDIVSIHLDFLAERVRKRQVEHLIAAFRGSGRALAVLGDFNCEWGERRRSFDLLGRELSLRPVETGGGPTFPAWRPLVRLDWVLISPELEFSSYRTLDDRLSDHLGVVAELAHREARAGAERGSDALAVGAAGLA
jgi:endonuclease/exonuclease/phosphatase family metal-dependent hydrolase